MNCAGCPYLSLLLLLKTVKLISAIRERKAKSLHQKQPTEVYFKGGVFKNSAKFTENTFFGVTIFIKYQARSLV